MIVRNYAILNLGICVIIRILVGRIYVYMRFPLRSIMCILELSTYDCHSSMMGI